MKRTHQYLFPALLLAVAGCNRGPVITIANQSSLTVSNIVIAGKGFTEHVPNLPKGADYKLTGHPNDKTMLNVSFDADGRHNDGSKGYFATGGFPVTASIGPDLEITVTVEMRSN